MLVRVLRVGGVVSCRHVIQLVTPFISDATPKQRLNLTELEPRTVEAVRASKFYLGLRNGRKDLDGILGRVNRTYAAVVVVQGIVLVAMWLFSRHFGL